ncbi:unnamed protein product, partial [Rotaria socialis]
MLIATLTTVEGGTPARGKAAESVQPGQRRASSSIWYSAPEKINVQPDKIRTIPSGTKTTSDTFTLINALQVFIISFIGAGVAAAIVVPLTISVLNSS